MGLFDIFKGKGSNDRDPAHSESSDGAQDSKQSIFAEKPATPVRTVRRQSGLERVLSKPSEISDTPVKNLFKRPTLNNGAPCSTAKCAGESDGQSDVWRFLLELKIDSEIINETETITSFLKVYDEILKNLQQLISIGARPKEMPESPSHVLNRLESNFQKHFQFALERAKDYSIKEIQEECENSFEREMKAQFFAREISKASNRLSEKTKQFSRRAIDEVFFAAGFIPPRGPIDNLEFTGEKMPITAELDRVDDMDGHTFERWCAELLKKNGFTQVEVTKGSGDQGVDILAVKDEIRYAIQCKCYSSDLGNKPVQEVHAGKAIYHCQVGAVMTNRHFTSGAKELAEATGVLLWDREKLAKMLTGKK